MPPRERTAALLAVLAAVGMVAGVSGLGPVVGPVVADQHTVDTADDYTEEANFTVNLPYPSDHYPGDQNEENGSIQYWAVGEEAMHAVDAEEGAFLDTIVISADWIDYSNCDVDNTAVFGFDRGNNNSGTEVDEDLVSRHKEATFRDDGITVEFYSWDDLGGDPPYGAPEDAIVAQQGAGSAGGPCLTMTSDPGWYQVQEFVNGTEADNGRDERPSEDATHAGILAKSNYIYVCECDSREEAEAELGPPPSDEDPDGGEDTPDGDGSDDGATPAADDSDGDGSEGGEGAGSDDATPGGDDATPGGDDARSDSDGGGTGDEGGDSTPGGEGDDGDGSGGDGGEGTDGAAGDAEGDAGGSGPGVEGDGTPTADDGPGVGAVGALLGLLAAALLARRRG